MAKSLGTYLDSKIRTAITPQSYYGSNSMQNFFTEIFCFNTTKEGKFFLAHAKTKREERYTRSVPVFTRGWA